ncbi:MAG: hypothetical protein NZT92_18360 [Abditibacteriales bacterium]|nr:hypothetical protein [Abditibacteriales bacterium]MDW8365768.1 hypothetical protein [Abditibacteriales bacterium]
MAQTMTEERIGAVIMTGPRQGEVVLLEPDVVANAPTAKDEELEEKFKAALADLRVALDRLIAAVKTSADDYEAMVDRWERRS